MNQQRLFILCGEAFSGKSTVAKKISGHFEANIVGRDEIYFATEKILALENTPEEDDDQLWLNLWPIVLQGVKNHLLNGSSVVVDDNCFYFRQREDLRKIAEKLNVKNTLIYLDTPYEILKQRKHDNKTLKIRHDVPSEWMEDDATVFERPNKDENHIIYKDEMSVEEILNS